ncbi:MAG TPA: APC family permease [Acidimicrobiia bacterium]|jgi:APA family basic amino acid/polyamine antiporter|nr:APC family permease [Acidimicrobiia bacterium]
MNQVLRREMGLGGAIVTGLGSILGTGAFVAIGVASGLWGDAVLLAIPIAGVVAAFNGLSSAFLAGRFPVAGGTYEYGYRALGPSWGFTAGWLFLLAKTASAAAAALGVSAFLDTPWDPRISAVAAVVVLTGLVLAGLRRTIVVNVVLVTVTVVAIVGFGIAGLTQPGPPLPIDAEALRVGLLPAVTFLFVAYTGYGRIATLGEEVRRPAVTIPRAVMATLVVAVCLYALVAIAGRAIGGEYWGAGLDNGTTLVDLVAQPSSTVVLIGGVTAMLGALLNLILGLSRVWLAMGRRHDMPERLSRLDHRSTPVAAISISAVPVLLVVLLGDISIAWSFSAFTVLLYYGITNLAAIAVDRRRWTAWLGLISCALLSFYVPPMVWVTGAGLVALGLIWKAQRRD